MSNNWDTFNNFHQNQMLNPFGCQDLSASYLRADQGAYPESITFTARVGNSGVLAIGPGTKVSFYHGDPLAGGALIGTTTIEQRMEPGQYLDLSVPWNSPPREQCEIYVRADDDGTGTGTGGGDRQIRGRGTGR